MTQQLNKNEVKEYIIPFGPSFSSVDAEKILVNLRLVGTSDA